MTGSKTVDVPRTWRVGSKTFTDKFAWTIPNTEELQKYVVQYGKAEGLIRYYLSARRETDKSVMYGKQLSCEDGRLLVTDKE